MTVLLYGEHSAVLKNTSQARHTGAEPHIGDCRHHVGHSDKGDYHPDGYNYEGFQQRKPCMTGLLHKKYSPVCLFGCWEVFL
jgi:hypothetical protein